MKRKILFALIIALVFSSYALANTGALQVSKASSQFATKIGPNGTRGSEYPHVTVEAQIQPDMLPSSGQYAIIVSEGTYDAKWWFGIYNNSGTYQLIAKANVTPDAWVSLEKNYAFSTTDYTHVAMTIEMGNEIRLLINGVDQGVSVSISGKTGFELETYNTTVGCLYNNAVATYGFSGKIDEVRIWSILRTAQQISDNMNDEIAPQSGLEAYWKFNGDFLDSSGNGNTLANNGGCTFSAEVPFIASGGSGTQSLIMTGEMRFDNMNIDFNDNDVTEHLIAGYDISDRIVVSIQDPVETTDKIIHEFVAFPAGWYLVIVRMTPDSNVSVMAQDSNGYTQIRYFDSTDGTELSGNNAMP